MQTFLTHVALPVVMILAIAALAMCATEPPAPVGKLVYEDNFANLENWLSEGPHTVEVKDHKLHIQTTGEQIGQYVWLKKDVPNDFRVEFDMTPSEKASDKGFYLIFFCQQGVKGEDILSDDLQNNYLPAKSWKPFQDFDKYVSQANRKQFHESRIRGYHTSYLRGESATCNLRKNPGLILLKQEKLTEKLPKNKVAHVVLTKIGGHIHLEVNGNVFMDYTDAKDIYTGGRFGLRAVYDADGYYENFKVYDLAK
ncbi:MAG: YesU family protein [Phycisphaerales bacterium]|nr:YesU family protein [Phycisphaerales bacterium]